MELSFKAGSRSMFKNWIILKRHWTPVRYGCAVLAAWVALSLWTFSPFLHRHAFALFLAAVVLTARFLGLGPSLLCSAVSIACLDFIVFLPRYKFTLNTPDDAERLLVFLALAILVASLSRQRTLAELRAESSVREMAAIVECSDDAIISTSTGGAILSWNRGAERVFGYTEEEAVGLPIARLAPPERQGEIEQNRQILNRGDSIESYQTEHMRKDGTRFPVQLTVAPLRNRDGGVVGSSAIARDISAQQRSDEAIRRSDKLAAAGRLAASVAHEINNPLEAVLNLLYLVRKDPQRSEQYLTMAEQEVGRVARIAQQALGSVRDTSAIGNFDAPKIMDEILELYARKLESNRIRVVRSYRAKAQVSGNPGEVRQLFTNLLMNAVDAINQGGSIHVRIRATRQWPTGKSGIRIMIADSGTGISPESRSRIFEPFFSTKQDAGNGLGLWISRGIVQKHGGSIRVRSRVAGPYRGTALSVFLPSAHAASQVA